METLNIDMTSIKRAFLHPLTSGYIKGTISGQNYSFSSAISCLWPSSLSHAVSRSCQRYCQKFVTAARSSAMTRRFIKYDQNVYPRVGYSDFNF